MERKMAQELVSIVIVTRNRKEVTSECLKSVLAMNYPHFEVILVDNGSTDGTAEEIKKRFSILKKVCIDEMVNTYDNGKIIDHDYIVQLEK